jgi:hypothetical protein
MHTVTNIASHISQRPQGSLTVLEIHQNDEVFETVALKIDRDGMTLRRSGLHSEVGEHVWLEFQLEDSGPSMRALTEVRAINGKQVRFRFLHQWPRDERRYFAYLAQRQAA